MSDSRKPSAESNKEQPTIEQQPVVVEAAKAAPLPKVPDRMKCPITKEIMLNPVILNCGNKHLVEKDSAKKILSIGNKCCPKCRGQIRQTQENPGYENDPNMKSAIEELLQDYPDLKSLLYQPEAPSAEAKPAPSVPSPAPAAADSDPLALTATPDEIAGQQAILDSINQRPVVPSEIKRDDASTTTARILSATAAADPAPAAPREEEITLPSFVAISNVQKQANGPFKVLLLGKYESGKTKFLSSIAEEKSISAFVHAIGIDFKTVRLDGQKFVIYDTSGQERFQTLTSNYYRGAHMMLFFGEDALEQFGKTRGQLGRDHQLKLFSITYREGNVIPTQVDTALEIAAQPVVTKPDATARDLGHQLLRHFSGVVPRAQPEVNNRVSLQAAPAPIRPQNNRSR